MADVLISALQLPAMCFNEKKLCLFEQHSAT